MPLYDYDCAACGRRFEVIHGVHDDGPATCPLCGKGPVRKAFATPTIHFKGSGWAKKDSRSASRKASTEKSETGEPAAAGSSNSGGESSESAGKDGAASTSKDGASSPAKPAAGD
jgi:putative FmdB family regulatory protein